MTSRYGHRCESTPAWGSRAATSCGGYCQACPCAWYSCSWHNNRPASTYGLEGFGGTSLLWKCSPQPGPDRRWGTDASVPSHLSGDHRRGMLSILCQSLKGSALAALSLGVTSLTTQPSGAAFPPLPPSPHASWGHSPNEAPALASLLQVGFCGSPS